MEEDSNIIFLFVDAKEDLVNWQPVFVLESHNESQHLFECPHQYFIAVNDSRNDGLYDIVLLFNSHLFVL